MPHSLRRALLIALLVFGVPFHALAVTLAGSDDFDDGVVDPLLWGADQGAGGALTEINQRLEFTVAPPGDALMTRPWILSPASYDENWSMQLDIHVGNVSLPSDGQDLMFGMGITAGGFVAALNIEYENLGGTLLRGFHAVNDGPGGAEVMAPTATTDGAGLLTFDASTKELAYWLDEDGAAGGYAWTLFQTVDLDAPATDWGLSPGATFDIGLFGESHGIAVASGDAFGDAFSVIPEPSTAWLLALGLAALAARRTARPR